MTQDTSTASTSHYDKMEDGDVVDRSKPSVRPRDAATLILVRRDGPKPRILMGKRSNKHDFMPEKYVFPGGRVDPTDARAPAATEFGEHVEQALTVNTRRKPRAFGLTAIRETFEETGLIIGQPGGVNGGPRNWREFLAEGALPCLQHLKFIGRAVTPPYRPKRFDARFFMAEAEDALIDERPANTSPELVDIRWVELEEAEQLDLPSVTRLMVKEVAEHLSAPKKGIRPAYLRYLAGGHRFDRL